MIALPHVAEPVKTVVQVVKIVLIIVQVVPIADVLTVQVTVVMRVLIAMLLVEEAARAHVMIVQKEILVEIQGIVEILAVEVVVETVMAVQGVTDVLVVMVVRVLVMAPACLDVYTLAKEIVKTDVQVHVLVGVQEVASSQRKAHLAVEQVQSPENSHPAPTKTEYIL